MQLRFFTIPLAGGEPAAELNQFLASQRVLAVDRQLAQDGNTSLWAVCVSYEPVGEARPAMPGKAGKLDYKEVLSEADFNTYAQLRTLRKALAEAEGVPPYALFTNEQLAGMVTRRATTLADLRDIPGIGPARVEKYGARFLAALATAGAPPAPAPSADAP